MKPIFIYLTIFPQYFDNYFQISLAKKIYETKLFDYRVYNLRDFADKRRVDDSPYGGGAGMVLKIEPLVNALSTIQEDYPNSYLILLSPQGKTFTQKDVSRLINQNSSLVFICGRYEGFDERIWYYIDEQISIGDFVTMGGEIPALAITDALIRVIPNAIKFESHQQETFHNSLLDFDTYTRPSVYENLKVPEVLLSGDHKKIAEWRQKNSQTKTKNKKKKYKNNQKIISKSLKKND
ncbi:tRNA (guanosine(37)-N1)-methyltransferase TrmD [endosymbiont GvMRE of Glomus versiforme]|uniref:tRNA (guanosine(37)-N1)-methyltransferase TrmD n=1 Tax=endosymbiont GvMRE of Glomus versiforme TaxID=2039283 RepID=UPI000EC0A9EE|nr:tRNA (guanosine(37)-N1)-methyltransferase TrmD [endosymbiont GvMRE of Glomus versiforme]RHZ35445.1 tRNA (guanine-N(1)-)-methyltransferase [endosymbiont GvMRE of Glomus versiforme]